MKPGITPAAPWFADVTTELGLNFTHDPGPVDGKYFMPQINGSGAALFDCDNDGRLDIYLLQCGGADSKSTSALFRQMPDGKFQDISQTSGLDINGLNLGVAIGDVNNDGWSDVLVTQYLGVKLFLNQGKGVFGEATAQAGLKNPHWGASASFVDYDRDGWLDLVVANYLEFD
ncbi:MAG: VCBS repeat-containing protein, partial [Pirellulaceae bacterium]|nr:VCBS repeat-containing protein [Pirellulaceae bacterium]